ncbi:Type IV fimbrial biogenesis protein FimT [gamma proteobacterium IMCC1989]|nr:Type IV fimbrial biogenesis protein FimT [gamma proteobacterium IMCC1989]
MRTMTSQKLTQRGFTLLELLCTLTIISILHSVAIPSFQSIIASTQRDALKQKLFTLIQYTRSKAAFQATTVILCPSTNQIDCINDWQQPLMIFSDTNDNKRRDNAEIIDRIEDIAQKNYQIRWRASGTSRYLRYVSDGSTVYQNGTFTLCPTIDNIKYISKLIIYRSGRARLGRKHEIKKTDCK